MLAVSCQQTCVEAHKTALISYKLLLELPMTEKTSPAHVLREEILLLTHEVEQRPCVFTAAGFFNVDCTMLLEIAASVASYVIIVLQFK